MKDFYKKKDKIKIKNNNKHNKELKHFNTESSLKENNFSNFSPLNENLKRKFNQLFNLNERRIKSNLNNLTYSNKEDLLSNIIIKNISPKNFNKNIKGLTTNNLINKTSDFFYSQKCSSKNSMKKIYDSPKSRNILPKMSPNIFNQNKRFNIFQSKKKIYNNINNKQLCLIPIFYIYKNKRKIFNMKKKIIKRNIINDKGVLSNNINNNDIFFNANNSYTKNINTNLNKIFKNNKNIKKLENSESKKLEDDMKPTIRFKNLKKSLFKENSKLYKMFLLFNKQISDKEKYIKLIEKNKDKEKNKFIEDNLIKIKF